MKDSIESILKSLNPRQLEAVEAEPGPVLVLAGAGSGKTRVLTCRMLYLLSHSGVPAHSILAMTFTNKAAGEMKDRIRGILGRHTEVSIGTFHSVFAKVLRREAGAVGYSPDFVIYDSEDQEKIVKDVMDELGLQKKQYSAKSVLGGISLVKNRLIAPASYAGMVTTPFEETVARVYPAYQDRLCRCNAMDFDDLIVVPIRLFAEHPGILEKYRSRFGFILVDEYQDTNRAQYVLVQALASVHRNLFVVGDDDQSIYRWRGADIRNILEFQKDFPEARVYRLEQNYRSTRNILKAAGSVVEKNKGRMGKVLWSENPEGEKVDVRETMNEQDEALRIVSSIRDEVFAHKRALGDFAVLYRTNAQSRALEDALRRSGMSYIIVGGVRFYERKEIKDVLAYLKWIANPRDEISFIRCINTPSRGIGEATTARILAYAMEHGWNLLQACLAADQIEDIPERIRKKVAVFASMIEKYVDLKDTIELQEWVPALIDETQLLSEYTGDPGIESQSRAENIREFISGVTEFAARAEPSLSNFLEEVSLITDVDAWEDKGTAVTLMTLHCAKGLEFPVVLITGLEEGLFPVSRSLDDPEALEEERRLFYVGLTRAREKVALFRAQSRRSYYEAGYRMPSRFLEELDPSVTRIIRPEARTMFRDRRRRTIESGAIPEFHPSFEMDTQEDSLLKPGVWVQHEVFGKGCILYTEDSGKKQKVCVRFENGEEKKFFSCFARFTVLL